MNSYLWIGIIYYSIFLMVLGFYTIFVPRSKRIETQKEYFKNIGWTEGLEQTDSKRKSFLDVFFTYLTTVILVILSPITVPLCFLILSFIILVLIILAWIFNQKNRRFWAIVSEGSSYVLTFVIYCMIYGIPALIGLIFGVPVKIIHFVIKKIKKSSIT